MSSQNDSILSFDSSSTGLIRKTPDYTVDNIYLNNDNQTQYHFLDLWRIK